MAVFDEVCHGGQFCGFSAFLVSSLPYAYESRREVSATAPTCYIFAAMMFRLWNHKPQIKHFLL